MTVFSSISRLAGGDASRWITSVSNDQCASQRSLQRSSSKIMVRIYNSRKEKSLRVARYCRELSTKKMAIQSWRLTCVKYISIARFLEEPITT